ncbi:MAG: hypothetical protein ABGZ35_10605, partial [Planctomycetaceae bacterium]
RLPAFSFRWSSGDTTMASIHKDGKGWKVSYVDPDGDRRSMRPGKVNKTTANQIARQVDLLVASKASGGTIELDTAKWLGDIGGKLHAKLVRSTSSACVDDNRSDHHDFNVRIRVL